MTSLDLEGGQDALGQGFPMPVLEAPVPRSKQVQVIWEIVG